MNVQIDLSKLHEVINNTFYPLLTNKSRFLIFRGGAGSGKSHFCVQKILIRILVGMQKGITLSFLCVRKTQPSLKRSVFTLIKKYIGLWGLTPLCKINKTDLTFTFINGSQIMCIGLDDVDKVKSIEQVDSIFIEEATELTSNDIMQLDLRMRGKCSTYYQLMLAFNPVGKHSHVYKMFYENEYKETTLHHSTFLDNEFLDASYRNTLNNLKEKDYNMWLIYYKGEWGELEHLVFKNWDIVDEIPDKYTQSDAIYGIDYGYSHKTAIVKIVKDNDDIFVQEMFYESGKTNMQVIEWVQKNLPHNAVVYFDSAEPARGAEARRLGLNFLPALKGPNSIKDSIDFIKRYNLHITKDSIGLIDELKCYKWKQDREGNVIEGKTVDFMDDLVASMRYGIYTHFGNKRSYEVYY